MNRHNCACCVALDSQSRRAMPNDDHVEFDWITDASGSIRLFTSIVSLEDERQRNKLAETLRNRRACLLY